MKKQSKRSRTLNKAKVRSKKNDNRMDSMIQRSTGRGTAADRLADIAPAVYYRSEAEMRRWLIANGFVQNIVSAPAEDATRAWITIRTNRDNFSEKFGEGLNISRFIENRMTELNLREKIESLIFNSRMYSNGGALYYGVLANSVQSSFELSKPIPETIQKLDFINVLTPEDISILPSLFDPLSKLYNENRFLVRGIDIHPSRVSWLVRMWMPKERRGVSVIDTILDGIKAQDTALWSVTSLLLEMSVKVFESDEFTNLPDDKKVQFLSTMKYVMSSQSMIGIGAGEKLGRMNISGIADSGLKQLFDFVFENLAGLAQMPKSRIMGRGTGIITEGDNEIMSYYESVSRLQELKIRPILEKIISLIISETDGEIYKKLGGNTSSLDWEFEFNPLWKLSPEKQADVDLKRAQKYQIDITNGVIGPDEIRKKEYDDLEDFSSWDDKGSVNFDQPPLPSPEDADRKKTELETEKNLVSNAT